jgi:hypothetical protein
MNQSNYTLRSLSSGFTIVLLLAITTRSSAQNIQFSIWADPLVSWFSSDTRETVNEGLRPGINLGLSIDSYFAENYAFSTGISLVNSSGRVSYGDTTNIRFIDSSIELPEDEIITYKIQYLSIPLGLKLRTNQIGYITVFTNIGIDPKVVIGGKCNIQSLDIEGENITEELRLFNLGYHLNVGIEYSLGGNTAIALGLGYENNFLDITYDYADQSKDKIKHNILRFKLGVIF